MPPIGKNRQFFRQKLKLSWAVSLDMVSFMQPIHLKNILRLLSLCPFQVSQPRHPFPPHWKSNQRFAESNRIPSWLWCRVPVQFFFGFSLGLNVRFRFNFDV